MTTTISKRSRPDGTDPLKRWTTAEFDRLIGQGLLEEGSGTYLWEGQIVEPMPEYQPHWNAVCNLFALLLARFLAADWTVGQTGPLALEDGTTPQPDLLVLKGPRTRFRSTPATPSGVALLIEVSGTSYPRDSGERLRKYAAAGVALYWIVNIPARRVEVYENPVDPDDGPAFYEKRTDYGIDMTIPLDLIHEGARVVGEVAVLDILRDSLEPLEGEGRA